MDGMLERREFLRGLLGSGLMARLAPGFAAAASLLGGAAPAEAGGFDSPIARRTMAAFADTVIPPDEGAPGGAAAGFVDVLYDPEFYAGMIGFEVPVAPAIRVLVLDLDRRSLGVGGHRFLNLTPEERHRVLAEALGGPLRLVYEALIALAKIVYFGAQRQPHGWEWIGYPGPAEAYPDASPAGPPPAGSMSEDGNPP